MNEHFELLIKDIKERIGLIKLIKILLDNPETLYSFDKLIELRASHHPCRGNYDVKWLHKIGVLKMTDSQLKLNPSFINKKLDA